MKHPSGVESITMVTMVLENYMLSVVSGDEGDLFLTFYSRAM